MNILIKIFKYIEPMWLGNDGKISKRSVLAIVLCIDFMRNVSHAVHKWDANKSLEGLALVLAVEASLIAGLLTLKAYQNISGDLRRGFNNFEVPVNDNKGVEEVK
jgi:hypothetical protein